MFDLRFPDHSPRLLRHPRFDHIEKDLIESLRAFDLKEHFLILSSGTTSQKIKGYALSKKALLANANAVNEHFSLTSNDVWALSLPSFHVGGLSVLLRAQLLGNKVVQTDSWNPQEWVNLLENEKVTITTVVPTQIFDLVKLKLKSPTSLRYIIVGGDFLSQALETEALKLGWPIIRTFGMTEVCSQLASAKIPSGSLEILPIHQIHISEEQRLTVKSQALFTLQFEFQGKITTATELCDENGFYLTQDRASFKDGVFKHLGRLDDQVKISGRLISFNELKDLLSDYTLKNGIFDQVEISLKDDSRKGLALVLMHLKTVSPQHLEEIVKVFLPLKVDEILSVESFQRTDLGKLKKL